MRILHVVPSYLPAIRYGGPIYSVHGLAKALSRQGHHVDVFTTNVDGPGVSAVPLGTPVVLDGVNVHYFACGTGRRLYHSADMARALAQHVKTYDVVHLHSVFLWPTLAAARAARAAGVPYILSPRGMLVSDLIRRKSRALKSLWISLFERRNVELAAAIHVTSDVEAVDLQELGLRPRRVINIPNGIDLPPAANQFEGAGLQPAQRPYILSLGRVNWKKGLDRLIPAMAHVPGANLVIAGNDEEGYTGTLETLAANCGVSDRVRFAGPVHGAEKWRLVRGACIFAMPSYSENFGNSALEAMACGVPVVVTPEVGLSTAIAAAGAGIVCDGDPSALGSELAALCADPARRKALGLAGVKSAAETFSWESIARAFGHAYASLNKK